MTMYDPDTQGTPEQRRKRDEFLARSDADTRKPTTPKIVERTEA